MVRPKVAERQNNPNLLLCERATGQTHLCLGVRGYNLSHPQRYAQELLATILGGGGMMSSRLFIEVREKLGLAYYVRTESESNSDTGFLVTQAGLDSQRTEEGISVILREYKKISQKIVSAAELKKAKENTKGRMALLLESSDAQASFHGFQDILEKKILTSKEIFEKIDKISKNDILKVAKDIFRPENLNLAILGPFKNKDKFQRILKFT